jgi:hypothetical protein
MGMKEAKRSCPCDAVLEHLPCCARSIIYCPTIVGGLVALILKKYALGERLPREILFDQPRFQLLASA